MRAIIGAICLVIVVSGICAIGMSLVVRQRDAALAEVEKIKEEVKELQEEKKELELRFGDEIEYIKKKLEIRSLLDKPVYIIKWTRWVDGEVGRTIWEEGVSFRDETSDIRYYYTCNTGIFCLTNSPGLFQKITDEEIVPPEEELNDIALAPYLQRK